MSFKPDVGREPSGQGDGGHRGLKVRDQLTTIMSLMPICL